MSSIRYDSGKLSRSRRDENGFLYSDSTVGRTGVLLYRNSDGSLRRELRLPEEAGNHDTLASMIGKPVIVTHQGGMVTTNNAKGRVVGAMLAARQDGNLTNSEIVLHDGAAIRGAEKGDYAELSLGYSLELEPRKGWYSAQHNRISDTQMDGYEPFDFIQRKLRVNHVALVRRGRAGSVARLNMDGNEQHSDEAGPCRAAAARAAMLANMGLRSNNAPRPTTAARHDAAPTTGSSAADARAAMLARLGLKA